LICRSEAILGNSEVNCRLKFEINTQKAHLFDPVTTSRIAHPGLCSC